MKDPLTGDNLSRLEYITRQIQTVVRTPWFILVFNVLTVAAFLTGHTDSWNFIMSALAIIVEWLVGTYMFGQTGRDALILRHMQQILEQLQQNKEAEK